MYTKNKILFLAIICLIPINSIAYKPLYHLMWAPSASDMDVENNSEFINVAMSLNDCREMLATYTNDNHMWCKPTPVHKLIKPLDLSKYK